MPISESIKQEQTVRQTSHDVMAFLRDAKLSQSFGEPFLRHFLSITEPERLLAWPHCLSLHPGAVGQVFPYPLDVDFMTKKALHGYMTPGLRAGPVSYEWSSLGPW